MERYSAAVQSAQTAYCDTMARWWGKVNAGRITQAQYWRISNGEPLAVCREAIRAATARYDAQGR